MRVEDNVTAPGRVTAGIALGAVGVLAFSFTMPFTRIAVAGMDPWFVAFGRAAVAGVLAIGYLLLSRARRPTGRQFRRLGVVVFGVVIGFPRSEERRVGKEC